MIRIHRYMKTQTEKILKLRSNKILPRVIVGKLLNLVLTASSFHRIRFSLLKLRVVT